MLRLLPHPLPEGICMKLVIVESPAKAKTINKYLGRTTRSWRAIGHVRDLPAKDGSVRPDEDFAMSWEVDPQGLETALRHRPFAQGCRRTDPRHRPRSRGRGDQLARPRRAAAEEGAEGPAGQPRRVQRHHQGRRDAGDEEPARRSMGRWSMPISPAARSTISSASRSRRCCGASCRARARPAACSRWRCGIVCDREAEIEKFRAVEYWSVARAAAREGQELRGPPLFGRRQGHRQARRQDRRRSRGAEGARIEAGRFASRSVDKKPTKRNPYAPFTTSSAAAGCLVAARLLAVAHHADRPAALRGRPHHLYANRRRADGARGHRRGPQRDREGVRRRLPAADPAHLPEQGQERAGSARGHPPDRHVPPPQHGAASMPSSRSSTA